MKIRIDGLTSLARPLCLAALLLPSGVIAAEPAAAPQPTCEGLGGVQLQLRCLADSIARDYFNMEGAQRYQNLAIIAFHEAGQRTREQQIGTLVTSSLAQLLVDEHQIRIIDREHLRSVLEEKELQRLLGIIDSGAEANLGKLAGAQALLTGTVTDLGDHFLVTTRLVSMETAAVLIAKSVHLEGRQTVVLSSESLLVRTRLGATWRSLLIPGWGQYYNQQGIKSLSFFLSTLAVAGAAVTVDGLGRADLAEYERDLRSTVHYRDDAETKFMVRNILLGAMAVLWAGNVLDAYLSGRDYEDLYLERPEVEVQVSLPAAGQRGGPAAGLALKVTW